MDILFLLIPFSVVLLLGIVGVFGWAVNSGQFDDLDEQARRALWESEAPAEGGVDKTTP
jgi:cbb3-type cytochrome oxidase maturation protein